MVNISLVLYHPKWEQEVLPLVRELLQVKNLRKIYLLDNSEDREIHPKTEIKHPKLRYMHMPSNLGYGKAHNIALRESVYQQTEFHLVMNSDIVVKAEDIDTGDGSVLSYNFDLEPFIKVGKYKGVEITLDEINVSSDEVDERMNMRLQQATEYEDQKDHARQHGHHDAAERLRRAADPADGNAGGCADHKAGI